MNWKNMKILSSSLFKKWTFREHFIWWAIVNCKTENRLFIVTWNKLYLYLYKCTPKFLSTEKSFFSTNAKKLKSDIEIKYQQRINIFVNHSFRPKKICTWRDPYQQGLISPLIHGCHNGWNNLCFKIWVFSVTNCLIAQMKIEICILYKKIESCECKGDCERSVRANPFELPLLLLMLMCSVAVEEIA